MQGVHPVEIAILGGHSNLSTLENYTNDCNLYISKEVFIKINKNLSSDSVDSKELYNIVFNKPKACPVPVEQCIPTEFSGVKLGVWTSSDVGACENYTCYNCSKWYCEPTRLNFSTLSKIAQEEINNHKKSLDTDISFYKNLFFNSALIPSEYESDVGVKKEYDLKIRTLLNKIKSDTNEIVNLESNLIKSNLVGSEYTDEDVIDKICLLDELFNEDTIYIQ